MRTLAEEWQQKAEEWKQKGAVSCRSIGVIVGTTVAGLGLHKAGRICGWHELQLHP